MSANKLCTQSKTHLILKRIFTIVIDCSNLKLYMSKSETVRNRLLVINRLIEKLEIPID